MKICSICNQTFTDDNLNFCLSDGGLLQPLRDEPPPTVLMNQARTTQPNWADFPTSSPWAAGQPLQPNQPFTPALIQGQNQTLPTIALVLGIFSIVLFCCHGGIPLGLAALITGYLGLKNSNDNPMQYGGRGLAIGGMITGAVGLLITIGLFLITILANLG